MRFPFLLLAMGLVAASLGCASPKPPVAPVASGRKITPQGATNFTSQTHGFAVWFPGRPKQSKGTSANISIFKTQVGSVNYGVVVSPLRPGTDPLTPKQNLDDMQKGMLESSRGNLQKLEDIQLSGFQGREIQHDVLNGRFIVRARIFWTPKGSFSVAAGGYKADMQKQAARIAHVFDSFRILPS